MKKKLLALVALSCFLVAGMLFASPVAVLAQATIQGVNTFAVSPNPASVGSNVTIDINSNMTAGGDAQTRFCLYAPNTAVGTFPANITLSYLVGFVSTPVTFAQNAGICPVRAGQTGQMYLSPATLPTGDTTYEGTASFTLNAAATPGTYSWTLLVEEPGGGVNPLSTSHQITAAQTPNTGISGRLIDSATLSPWLYGAEIQVIQTNGANTGLKGSTFASTTDGTWSISFDSTDDLSLCAGNCSLGNSFATYQVVVNFTCNLNSVNGTRLTISDPNTDPNCPTTGLVGVPLNYEITVTDNDNGAVRDIGDMETNRGPLAVTLSGFDANNSFAGSYAIAALFILLGGASAFALRRRSAVQA